VTYLLLSLCFLAGAAIVLGIALAVSRDRPRLLRRWTLPVALAGVVVLALTAIFDNVMIAAGLMTYADDRISGARLGLMPIEDFSYPIAALLLLPSAWLLLRPRRRRP
jgi:lycopene cyclase domain-containing protein